VLETLSRKGRPAYVNSRLVQAQPRSAAASDVEYVFMPFDPVQTRRFLGVSQLTEMAGELGGKLHTFGWGALGHFVVFGARQGNSCPSYRPLPQSSNTRPCLSMDGARTESGCKRGLRSYSCVALSSARRAG